MWSAVGHQVVESGKIRCGQSKSMAYTVGWEKFVVKFRSNFLKLLRIFHYIEKNYYEYSRFNFFEDFVKKTCEFWNSIIFDLKKNFRTKIRIKFSEKFQKSNFYTSSSMLKVKWKLTLSNFTTNISSL